MQRTMEPFRLFFPLGIVLGIWTSFVWVAFAAGLTNSYPGFFHAHGMVSGFLFAFVYGFFMTAIPRFTGTTQASRVEIMVGLSLLLGGMAALLTGNMAQYHGLSIAGIVFLIFFAARRVPKGSRRLPPTFTLVAVGLVTGLIGQGLLFAVEWGLLSIAWQVPARTLYLNDMMLALVLGVGGNLVPAILGHQSLPDRDEDGRSVDRRRTRGRLATTMASLYVAAMALTLGGQQDIANLLKLAVVVSVGGIFWRVHTLPPIKAPLQLWMWIAAWLVILGSLALTVWPEARIHCLHLVYIGGFGLMALMVASQVTILHSKTLSPRQFRRSKVLWLVGASIVMATLTRASAPIIGNAYLSHLGYAAGVWAFALVVWLAAFVRYLV